MNDSEIQRMVRSEVIRQLNVILSGSSGGTTADAQTETINDMYPGMPGITNRPVMHPYGFASRAVAKTIQVVAKQGADPTNRIVLGHRDADRPDDLAEGESCLYSSGGWSIKVRGDKVVIGNDDETQVFTLDGDTWEMAVGDVSITLTSTGVQVALGAAGKFSFTNAQGEFVAALIQLLQNSTAGGYPLLPDPASLAILQSMQE